MERWDKINSPRMVHPGKRLNQNKTREDVFIVSAIL